MNREKEQKCILGFNEALTMTLDNIAPLASQRVALCDAVGNVLAEDLVALVDSPSIDGSLRDGYAVVAEDIRFATAENPVELPLLGGVAAGDVCLVRGGSQRVVRVLTGAPIPDGSDAVLAEEFVAVSDTTVQFFTNAESGQNILFRGSDVKKGVLLACSGSHITPGLLGLFAAAGHSEVEVVSQPRVACIATGDEVVAPGLPLAAGKLYASNITMLAGWCRLYGFPVTTTLVPDDQQSIVEAICALQMSHDVIITSGGAWMGERDLVARALSSLGWQKVFHQIRIAPGKGVGFGLLEQTPVFILPGGPPANLMGFLQIVLPGLQRLCGKSFSGLPKCQVIISEEITARFADWTQFYYGVLDEKEDAGDAVFRVVCTKSRLRAMSEAQVIVRIPEGQTSLAKGAVVSAQRLDCHG